MTAAGADQVTTPGRSKLHWLNLLPMSIWMLVFFVAPVGILLLYSVWQVEEFQLQQVFTLDNYIAIFTKPLLYKAFLLSLQVAAFSTFAALAIAYPFAFFVAKRMSRFQTIALLAVILPFWTSYILRAYAWRILLGPNGAINQGLGAAGLIDEPIDALLYSPTATGIGLLYVFLPLAILPIYSVLERIPNSLSEAAADLGASPWQTFKEVTLPLSLPGVAVGGVFTFVFGIGEFVIPALLGGGKRLLYAEAIVLRINAQQDWPAAAAMSIVLMLITLGLVALLGRRVRKAGLF